MWNKKEMRQLDATLTREPLTLTFDFDLWPWKFKVKLYLSNGRLDCHGTKGTGVIRMPWCKTQPLCDPEAEVLLPTGWLKMSAFPSTRLVSKYLLVFILQWRNHLFRCIKLPWMIMPMDFSIVIHVWLFWISPMQSSSQVHLCIRTVPSRPSDAYTYASVA